MRKIRVFQEDAYLSLDYQNQTGEIYRKVGGGIERAEVEIEREEPLKRQLLSFIECARDGPAAKGFGFRGDRGARVGGGNHERSIAAMSGDEFSSDALRRSNIVTCSENVRKHVPPKK